MKHRREIKRSDCYGCHNENYFYGLGGKDKCMYFEDAEMGLARLQRVHAPPKSYTGQWKLTPKCYQTRGQRFVERKDDKLGEL